MVEGGHQYFDIRVLNQKSGGWCRGVLALEFNVQQRVVRSGRKVRPLRLTKVPQRRFQHPACRVFPPLPLRLARFGSLCDRGARRV